jgi:hypothetical protein
MPFYEMSVATVAALTNAPAAAIRAPTNAIKVWEIWWEITAATATTISLYRNTASGYTATTSTSVGQMTDPSIGTAGTGVLDTAWSTPPTITSGAKIRRSAVAGTIGAGAAWKFRNGLIIRSGTATDNLVLWNDTAATISAAICFVVWEE